MSKTVTTLNKRLATIESFVDDGFDHIWDCCCDHGKLGKQLLRNQSAPHIHFVDIVPSIIDTLNQSLAKGAWPKNSEYSVYCQDVAKLPLDKFSPSDKHLIIIAGVGGKLTLSFVAELAKQYGHLNLQFLLCPLRHQFELRQGASAAGLSLVNEQLIEHDKRFYEVMLLSNDAGEAIADVGSVLWQHATPMHVRYLQGIVAHYQRMANSPTSDVANELEQYQTLLASITHQ